MAEQPDALVASQHLLDIHRANYAVFTAKTEEEIADTVYEVLKKSHYLAIYYTFDGSSLNFAKAFLPEYKSITNLKTESVPLSPADIAVQYSEGVVIEEIADTKMTPALISMLKEMGYTKAAFLPIIESVELRGLLLFGATADQVLDEETIEPYIKLSEILTLVLDKVRATRAMQQRLRELETISATSEAVSTSSDLNALYKIIHENIRATVGDMEFLIALYTAETNSISIPYYYEQGEYGTIESFPLGEGLISILIRTHQPLMLLEDTENRARALGAKIIGSSAKSWLGCPLIIGGEAIGAIVVQDLNQENRFTQDDLRLIVALSAQIAGAVYNARLFSETKRRALQLQTAAEISRDVSGSLIIGDLLRKAVTLIRERFNFYHAAVFLIEGENAVIREATGDAGMQMKHQGHKLKVGSKSIVGTSTSTGEALVVNDVLSDPTYYPNPLMPDTRAEAAIPLKTGERVVGAIDVQSNTPFSFQEDDIKILQILADQLTVAIINSELFAEAQERLSQHRLLHHVTTAAASSTTIEDALNSAVQGLQVTLGGDQISILLSDSEHKNLEVKSSIGYSGDDISRLRIPFGVGATGWVASHRQPLRISDVTKDARYIKVNDRVRSELAIPLIYRNEVLGVLNVESQRVNGYTESDEEMLGTLGGSLAAIIAHSRLLEQFRERAERERLLFEATNKIRRSTNPQNIIAISANEVGKALGARKVRVQVDLGDPNNLRNPQQGKS